MRTTIKVSIIGLLLAISTLVFAHRVLTGSESAGQTIGLTAPAEVSASDNSYVTKVGISWDTVPGATLYRIFRNATNDSGAATAIGTTAEGTFFDNTAAAGQTFFYWVRAENGSILSPLSVPDQGTRANGNINGAGPLNPPPQPAGNLVTATKAYLGKTLFWDEQLSATGTVACGTCHFAANGGSDSRSAVGSTRARNAGADGVFGTADDVFASPGVISNNSDGTYSFSALYGFHEQVTGRKSRSYIDAGFSPNALFWDGRATGTFTDPIGGAVVLPNGAALESQVLGPPVSSTEMANANRTWVDVAARVANSSPLALSPSVPAGLRNWINGRSYPALFQEAFGSSDVTPVRIAEAIATFERTLYSDRTPFDLATQNITPLGAAEQRGQGIFNGRCNACHAGTLFSDNQFHNIGVRPQTEDTGRFQVTGNANNIGEFRTP
ncbi:MAG TPA: cytochrome-c peroxidase, partial [Pyrinomonadaceae bacterium]|nr:cytochrome-c peroxidase [Pyrinomonadaceae bacterium]